MGTSWHRRSERKRVVLVVVAAAALVYLTATTSTSLFSRRAHNIFRSHDSLTEYDAAVLQSSINKCRSAQLPAGPPPDFSARTRSDRSIEDAVPIVFRNVTLWTGQPTESSHDLGEIRFSADMLIEDGIIKKVEKSGAISTPRGAHAIEGHGRWLTPGIIDVHVHAGAGTTPEFSATNDVNSLVGPTQPFLRSIDSLHVHDASLVSIAMGGITTGLMLPGSANSIGGQAFPIKMGRFGNRQARKGAWTKVIEPPIASSPSRDEDISTGMESVKNSTRWRYMKMACGENPRRIYSQTRMDEAYHFRQQFTDARDLLHKQESFCAAVKPYDGKTRTARQGALSSLTFPDDLKLEALVDVMRGKVKVNTHCYTVEDLTSFVSHAKEFNFPIAAFHHAHEAYLVPDLLKSLPGKERPAIAIFSLNANYKVEAAYGTPFAARLLTDNGFTVHLKSDHPVTDSRRLIVQVAQAHHYGFPAGAALRSVTSSAAKTLGLDHRIGQAKVGMDADLVMWDRFPLALGATPREVIIDGNRQALKVDDSLMLGSRAPQNGASSDFAHSTPHMANYTNEIKRVKNNYPAIIAGEMSAFPVLQHQVSSIALHNVSAVYTLEAGGDSGSKHVVEQVREHNSSDLYSIHISGGKIATMCRTRKASCRHAMAEADKQVDTRAGTIIPGLVHVGSALGLEDIISEASASDGRQDGNFSSLTARAIDGFMLGGNELRLAAVSGIRTLVGVPYGQGPKLGIASHIDVGVEELFEDSAIRKREVALCTVMRRGSNGPVSSQIAQIRQLLEKASKDSQPEDDNSRIWRDVQEGWLPLVVEAASAEVLARLIDLKQSYPSIKLTIKNGAEAGFGSLPRMLKEADIGVLVDAVHWPQSYDERRSLRERGVYANGMEPSTRAAQHEIAMKLASNSSEASAQVAATRTPSLVGRLHAAGVRVAVMNSGTIPASTLLWDTIEAGGKAGLSRQDTLDLAVGQVADVLGLSLSDADMVAFDGDVFEYGARVVAAVSSRGIDLVDDE